MENLIYTFITGATAGLGIFAIILILSVAVEGLILIFRGRGR